MERKTEKLIEKQREIKRGRGRHGEKCREKQKKKLRNKERRREKEFTFRSFSQPENNTLSANT